VLELPSVTLVIYDTVAPNLSTICLGDTLREVKFAEAHFWSTTSPPSDFDCLCFLTEASGSKQKDLSQLWYKIPSSVITPFVLRVEWDAGISDPEMWMDEFLEYDYVGAPWPWHQDLSVGNSGFCLLSRKLLRFLQINPKRFPFKLDWDDVLCREYRPALESEGFRWAPEELAGRFSLEYGPLRPSFGYHDCRNWPRVLSSRDRMRRLENPDPYVLSHKSWNEMLQLNPR